MFIFHVVFWLLSVVFSIQLYQIRKQQRDLYKREFLLTKRMVSDNVDSQYVKREIDQRLDNLEKNVEQILKQLRDERDI